MARRAALTALVVLVAVGGLAPRLAMAQWGRRGGYVPGAQGGTLAPPYGGYSGPAYPAPPPGGYAPPGGYSAPPAGYATAPPPGQGYPPPGYAGAGYPASSTPPPAYQPPYAYPQQGQSPQQAANDQSQCGSWASQQTGYNPNAPAAGASAGTAARTSGPTGLFGGIQRREERRDFRRQQWTGQTNAASQQDGYGRAVQACLSARGYTVR
jgi:hypothetical protein